MAAEEPGDLREHGMGELFKQLSDDLSTLVRQELKLAQAEVTEKGKKAGIGAGMLGGAGLIGVLALGALDRLRLPICQRRHAARSIVREVQMGEILLWSLLGILLVVAVLAIVAV